MTKQFKILKNFVEQLFAQKKIWIIREQNRSKCHKIVLFLENFSENRGKVDSLKTQNGIL